MAPQNGNQILVHRDEEAGALTISRLTGVITTPGIDRPEWAGGLASAILNERQDYYKSRLSPFGAAPLMNPATINYADLSWTGVDGDGEVVVIEANAEFRMDVLGDILGIDREDPDAAQPFGADVVAEAELDQQPQVATAEEATAIDDELASKFGTSPAATEQQRKTGTN